MKNVIVVLFIILYSCNFSAGIPQSSLNIIESKNRLFFLREYYSLDKNKRIKDFDIEDVWLEDCWTKNNYGQNFIFTDSNYCQILIKVIDNKNRNVTDNIFLKINDKKIFYNNKSINLGMRIISGNRFYYKKIERDILNSDTIYLMSRNYTLPKDDRNSITFIKK